MKDNFKSVGFPYPENLIMQFVGGSQLHGAKLEGTDDTDWYGIFIEPPEKALGLDRYEHFVYTTGTERGRHIASDVDVTLYSLRKWAGLAAKGNPTILHFLFAPPEKTSTSWETIRFNRFTFLSRKAVGQFLGYANEQLRRLLKERGGKDCNRPFLEEQFGYDTKYAMTMLRLLYECKELIETANITFPNPNKELLINVRKGKYKLYEIEQMTQQLETEILVAKENSVLPEEVDRELISWIITKVYQEFWALDKATLAYKLYGHTYAAGS
jgi:predicted nucleotidyltransferase